MLICKELEQKIVADLKGRIGEANGVKVRGSWEDAGRGLIKWVNEDTTAPAFVSVAVGTPQRETRSANQLSFSANITLFVRIELDVAASIMCGTAEKIESAVTEWQSFTYQQFFTAFDIEGVLSVDDITVGGGGSPTLNNGIASVTWPVVLTGSLVEISEQTERS